MNKNIKSNLLVKSYRFWWIYVLLALFSILAFLTAASGLYNQGVKKLSEVTNQIVVLPLAPDRPFVLGLDLQGGTQLIYEADVSAITEGNRTSALEGVRDVIARRVDATGVNEPMIQVNRTIAGDYRIIAELAGVSDINEAIKMIGDTPILEFKEQDDQLLEEKFEEARQKAEAETIEIAEEALTKILAANSIKEIKDDYLELADYKEGEWINQLNNPELASSLSELELGEIHSQIVFDGVSFKIVKLLDSREFSVETEDELDIEINSQEYLINSLSFLVNYVIPDIDPDLAWKNTTLTGQQLRRSVLQFNPNDGRPEVVLEFDSEGRELFAEITKRNIGSPVAIFLDDYPISIPTVNEEIPDGRAIISGQFDVQEARLLVQRLNTGALPVPITLIGQQTVGASLGEKSINSSLMAGLLGFLLVALFMLLYYRISGLVAIVSLGIYVLVVLSIFKSLPIILAIIFIALLIILFSLVFNELKIFDGLVSLTLFLVITIFLIFYAINPVTLTLAGITGFILSIGMAVDANILIFERMKEELRAGKALGSAIDEGFRRAWPSIRDGNITTILVCFALMTFGTGLVKGFGATLFIGVSISMFSSIVITRILLRLVRGKWLEKRTFLLGVKIRKDI